MRRRSVQYVQDALAFCDRHGIDEYSVHAGFRADPDESFRFPERPAVSAAQGLENFRRSLETLLPVAETRGVNLAIENNVVTGEHLADDGESAGC